MAPGPVSSVLTTASLISTSSSEPRRPPRWEPEGLGLSLTMTGDNASGLGGRVRARPRDRELRWLREMTAGEARSPNGTSLSLLASGTRLSLRLGTMDHPSPEVTDGATGDWVHNTGDGDRQERWSSVIVRGSERSFAGGVLTVNVAIADVAG